VTQPRGRMTVDSKKSLGWQRSSGASGSHHLPFRQVLSVASPTLMCLNILEFLTTPFPSTVDVVDFVVGKGVRCQSTLGAVIPLEKKQIGYGAHLLLHQVLSLQVIENKDQRACL